MTPLTEEEKAFIAQHLQDDVRELALKFAGKSPLPYRFLIQQIAARQKAVVKLPTLAANPEILFPPLQNLEQTSSEITADYKSTLISSETGADLTGGFGIDTIAFAKRCTSFHYIEPNAELAELSSYNFNLLALPITVHQQPCEVFLAQHTSPLDFIYLDPSRKDANKQKVVFLEDYSPNVLEIKDDLLRLSEAILIKTAPLLDITDTIRKLESVSEVHIVAVKNEVKEVLYLLNKNKKTTTIKTINFTATENQTFDFEMNTETPQNTYALPQKYLYEPNAAIMKSGGFFKLGNALDLAKLHPNSHLFTSEILISTFPGRVFEIKAVLPYRKKEIQHMVKANITVRNFPDNVDTIRKKLKIKPGGEGYLFATTLIDDKPVLLECRKIE